MPGTRRQLQPKRLLVGDGIALCVYFSLLLNVNEDDLLMQLRRFPPELLLPLVLLKPITWLLRFKVWQYFFGVVGVRDKTGATNSAMLYLAGFSMAVSPGNSAEVLKGLVLRSWPGLPLGRGIPVIVAELVVETLSVLILANAGLLLRAATLEPGPAQSLLVVAAGLLGGSILFLQSRTAQRQSFQVC